MLREDLQPREQGRAHVQADEAEPGGKILHARNHKSEIHWKMPLKIRWTIPVKIHWTSGIVQWTFSGIFQRVFIFVRSGA